MTLPLSQDASAPSVSALPVVPGDPAALAAAHSSAVERSPHDPKDAAQSRQAQPEPAILPGADDAAFGPRQFSFGVISDVQHADIPDGVSVHGVPRFYRNSLVALRRAVSHWREMGSHLSFGVHFGDIIDGLQPRHRSEEVLGDVLEAMNGLGLPMYHMLGNHCLYNLSRPVLNDRLHIPAQPDGSSYYSFCPHPGWRLVVLDGFDVSLLGWPPGHERHEAAARILAERNPNENKNSPAGLLGVARRFVRFGGGCSREQLEWLQSELQASQRARQRVIVCCHLPIMPGTCPPTCLLWDYPAVLSLLRASRVVAATIAGHAHQNGYVADAWGIHHLVLPGALETPPGRDGYGWVDAHPNALLLRGVDTMMSAVMRLPPLPPVRPPWWRAWWRAAAAAAAPAAVPAVAAR